MISLQNYASATVLKHLFRNSTKLCKCMSSSKDSPPNKSTEVSDLSNEVHISTKVELANKTTKKDLQWRSPWHEKESHYFNHLRAFYSEDSNAPFLKFLQNPGFEFRKWWLARDEEKEKAMQQYIPERNKILGNELAAAHFIVHRGGAVKFHSDDKWIKANEFNQYSLPSHYEDNMYLEGIDCEDMKLYYEGLVNLRNLEKVEWFSINGCKHLDNWAFDCICNIFGDTLIYLDIRNCPGITINGLCALTKMKKLKILCLDDLLSTKVFELTCIMLQDINPDLDIRIRH